jgi:hypothetical protein
MPSNFLQKTIVISYTNHQRSFDPLFSSSPARLR